jgi:hypothetical protein
MTNLPAAPGDVLAVWTGDGPLQDLIRVGEVLHGLPAVANHTTGLASPRTRWTRCT